ncbi:hypothetical protein [Palleronia caenipelagi]|uniref:UDP-N-acetylglucosamine 2-epimerase domain-containing protein n=1 Tax=Palleronia caenipelagi TaxID=2489174 RepID=A0A547PLC5_9RHOB|nr:hypothetical protein [Palleronia caenipelagi]TRD14945.1 hypothetical protein FEV53_18010 [Palleronia caenipelagi]
MPLKTLEDTALQIAKFWAQDIMSSVLAELVREGRRNQVFFALVRSLRGSPLGLQFLLLSAAALFSGPWFAERNRGPGYLVSFSDKNAAALKRLDGISQKTGGPSLPINQIRLSVFRRIRLILFHRDAGASARWLAKNGSDEAVVLMQQIIGVSSAMLFDSDLRNARPALVVVANDHIPPAVALLTVAAELGIPRAYIQHAPVTKYFPPLSVELAFLDSEASIKAYKAAAQRSGSPAGPTIVCLLPSPEIKTMASARKSSQSKKIDVCIALSLYPEPDVLDKLVCDLSAVSSVGRIQIRPHPRYRGPFRMSSGLPSGVTVEQVFASVDTLLQDFDAFIVGNSGIAVELLRRGGLTLYQEGLDRLASDYFGLVQSGVLPRMDLGLFTKPDLLSHVFDGQWRDRLTEIALPHAHENIRLETRIGEYLCEFMQPSQFRTR